MGLFGGGNSSSKTVYRTENYDQSKNINADNILGDGAISLGAASDFKLVDAGGILAEELNQQIDNADRSVKSSNTSTISTVKAASDNLNLSGDNITFQGFSDKAAEVVNNAVSSLGIAANTSIGQKTTATGAKSFASQKATGGVNKNALIFGVVGLGLFLYMKRKK